MNHVRWIKFFQHLPQGSAEFSLDVSMRPAQFRRFARKWNQINGRWTLIPLPNRRILQSRVH